MRRAMNPHRLRAWKDGAIVFAFGFCWTVGLVMVVPVP